MVLNKVEICGVNTAKLPLLSDGEKEVLFEKIKAGDEEAKEQYIKGNLRLVLSVIKRFFMKPFFLFPDRLQSNPQKPVLKHPFPAW